MKLTANIQGEVGAIAHKVAGADGQFRTEIAVNLDGTAFAIWLEFVSYKTANVLLAAQVTEITMPGLDKPTVWSMFGGLIAEIAELASETKRKLELDAKVKALQDRIVLSDNDMERSLLEIYIGILYTAEGTTSEIVDLSHDHMRRVANTVTNVRGNGAACGGTDVGGAARIDAACAKLETLNEQARRFGYVLRQAAGAEIAK